MRIGILTGGGDVQALNAVIASASDTAEKLGIELLGFHKGWNGLLKNNYTVLNRVTLNPAIGGTILKSSRMNIARIEGGPQNILGNLKKNKITGLINIGGEDTLSNSFLIEPFPQVLIAKTIDNDVGKIDDAKKEFDIRAITNYFTLGYPTAAEKISSFVSQKEGLRTTAYSHERIIIVEAMGMHSGWLALSSAMGHPDLIIIPEFPLRYDFFLEKAKTLYEKQGHVIVVIAEGAKWEDGSFIYAEKDEIEEFGHPRFGGSANALKNLLKKDLAGFCDTRNVNAMNPSYLYRSGAPNGLDELWAKKQGERAVRLLARGKNDSVFLSIQKDESGFNIKEISLSNFKSIKEMHRFVDRRFYDPVEFKITEAGKRYLKEIIRELPLDESYGFKPRCNKREFN